MSVVWLADDQLAGRRVAVKELRPPPQLSDADRDIHTRRALQEARSAASISHSGAVTLFDVLPASAADDAIYLIMELIHGPTLAQLISSHGRLSDATVVSIGNQLLDVLQAAHNLGIVHRDIKPSNILISAGNQAKLTDFGIAHTVGDPRITRSGAMGTLPYMAPELFTSEPITPAADLWSLGATLYYAAEGRGPFERDEAGAVLTAVLLDDIPVARCSPGLSHAISRMLQRDPVRRATIAQARQLLQAAEHVADKQSERRSDSGQSSGDQPPPGDEPPGDELPSDPSRVPERPGDKPPSGPAPSPPAAATVFTNMRSPVSLALLRAGWVIVLIGGGVGALIVGLRISFTALLLALLAYLIVMLVGKISVAGILRRRRTLVFDSRGLAVSVATTQQNQRLIAEARWDHVARIGYFRRPTKPDTMFLAAWVSGGKAEPAKLLYLCPLGSPDFPIDEIRAAIESYCPSVSFDAMPDPV